MRCILHTFDFVVIFVASCSFRCKRMLPPQSKRCASTLRCAANGFNHVNVKDRGGRMAVFFSSPISHINHACIFEIVQFADSSQFCRRKFRDKFTILLYISPLYEYQLCVVVPFFFFHIKLFSLKFTWNDYIIGIVSYNKMLTNSK